MLRFSSEQVAGAPAPSVLPKDPLPVLEMVRVKMYRVMRPCWCIRGRHW